VNCSDGASDTLFGGAGTVDYIIGGAYNDTIEGNEGMDLVLGDHAEVHFFQSSHKLKYVTTIDPECTPGDDFISLGNGDDMVSISSYE